MTRAPHSGKKERTRVSLHTRKMLTNTVGWSTSVPSPLWGKPQAARSGQSLVDRRRAAAIAVPMTVRPSNA